MKQKRTKDDSFEYPPTKCSLVHLVNQLAWAAENDIQLSIIDLDESVAISHKKSQWDYCFRIRSPKERLMAEKIILNWVNGIFPDLDDKEYDGEWDKVDWP